MTPFTTFTAPAVPLDRANVDTDQIVPARFLRRPRSEGYDSFFFTDLKQEQPDLPFNDPVYDTAGIIVADRNFGCGSSREQAVWALTDSGFRCVLAPSFGDIFYNNAAKQGLLLVRVDADTAAGIRDALRAAPGAAMTVDLEAQTFAAPGCPDGRFEIEPAIRRRLLLGLDEIGMTLEHEAEIAAFEQGYRDRFDWLFRATGA